MKQLPPGFIPDGFVPDDVRTMEVVDYLPSVQLSLPANLQNELNEALNGDEPSFMFGWLERWSIESQGKTNQARASKVASVAGLAQSYALVYQQAVANQRLPLNLHQEHQIHDLTHRQNLLALDNAFKVAIIAHRLIELAAHEGLTLELYLTMLQKKLELDHRKEEIEQDLYKQEEQKRIDRENELRTAHNQISTRGLTKQQGLIELNNLEESISRRNKEIAALRKDTTISDEERKEEIDNKTKSKDILEAARVRLEKRLGQIDSGEDV